MYWDGLSVNRTQGAVIGCRTRATTNRITIQTTSTAPRSVRVGFNTTRRRKYPISPPLAPSLTTEPPLQVSPRNRCLRTKLSPSAICCTCFTSTIYSGVSTLGRPKKTKTSALTEPLLTAEVCDTELPDPDTHILLADDLLYADGIEDSVPGSAVQTDIGKVRHWSVDDHHSSGMSQQMSSATSALNFVT